MIVTVKYFGVLTDVTQISEEQFSFLMTPISVNQFMQELKRKYPRIIESNFTIAINQSISRGETLLNNNDIIALLPPFAGG